MWFLMFAFFVCGMALGVPLGRREKCPVCLGVEPTSHASREQAYDKGGAGT